MSQLCDSCGRFFNSPEKVLSNLPNLIEDDIPILQWDVDSTDIVGTEMIRDTYPDFPALTTSAEKGCELCKILVENLHEHIASGKPPWHHEQFKQGENVSVKKCWWKGGWGPKWGITYGEGRLVDIDCKLSAYFGTLSTKILEGIVLTIRPGGDKLHFPWEWDLDIRVCIPLYADTGSRVAKHLNIRNRTPQKDIESPQGVSMMRGWLQECDKQHNATCESDNPTQTELPSRLIYVGIEKSNILDTAPYLVDVKTLQWQTLRYAALSYCWGEHETLFKTSTRNLDILKRHGGWPRPIPKTIEDAIRMSRVLGLQYLWIDALCIVQDDQKDLETEVSKMASIYRNSYVTIIAANATSSTEGFIHPRSLDELRPITFRSKLCESVHGALYLQMPKFRGRSSGPRTTWQTIESSVWNSRGWTFQERHIPNRALYFGPAAVHFLCNACYRCETHTGDLVRQRHWLPEVTASLKDLDDEHTRTECSENLVKPTNDVYRLWYRMASKYSGRILTKPDDKLPAISGIARTLQVALKKDGHEDEYLAGLWRKDLRRGLLWYTRDSETPTTDQSHGVGPSWSWATRNASVDWWAAVETSPHRRELECHILDAKVWYRGADEFSQIQGGCLKLSGMMTSMSDIVAAESGSRNGPDNIEFTFRSSGQQRVQMYFGLRWDVEQTEIWREGSDHLWLLYLDYDSTILGLLLCKEVQKADKSFCNPHAGIAQFRRVGTFSGSWFSRGELPMDWVSRTWTRETICIV